MKTLTLTFLLALTILVIAQSNVVASSEVAFGVCLVMTALLGWVFWSLSKRNQLLQANTRENYAKANPSCVIGERMVCNSCGSGDIAAVTNTTHSAFRDHNCLMCGTTLFHSPK